MRRLTLAIALACVLSGASHAGEIPSTGVVAQPTPSPVSVAGAPTTGAAAPQSSTTVLTIIVTLISIIR